MVPVIPVPKWNRQKYAIVPAVLYGPVFTTQAELLHGFVSKLIPRAAACVGTVDNDVAEETV